MPSIFTRIMDGEIPARFVWQDARCVAFLTVAPIRPGHTLVVPRREVDHWLDLAPDELTHLMHSAQIVGQAIDRAFQPTKVGLVVAGLEVPHVHIHLVPVDTLEDLDFSRADRDPEPSTLDEAATAIRRGLREMGRPEAT